MSEDRVEHCVTCHKRIRVPTPPSVVYVRPGQRAVPSPGSKDAIKRGCKCAVLDNHHGHGFGPGNDQFWITEGCLLHDPKTE